jgi:ABC-type branched-subunit amino acid transport system ATPase component
MSTEGTKVLQSAKLFDEFRIGKFRGLDDLSLQQLGRINLLVGGNNSGKTSVLESLGVFANPLDIAAWATVARNREVRSSFVLERTGLNAVEAIRWLFPQRAFDDIRPNSEAKSHFQLSCIGDSKIRELHAECVSIRGIPPEPPRHLRRQATETSGLVEDQGWLVSAQIIVDQGSLINEPDAVEVQLWPSVGFYRGARRTGPHIRAVTLAPYSHRNQPLQLRKLSELIESNQTLDVLELLRDLDDDIRDLKIVTDRYTGAPTILVNHRRSGAVPISVLGDGFRRALAIALSIPQARDGLLLIDEIETALFVTFLQTLFAWLVRVCEAFNVQLFATTHSLEAVTAMVNAVPGKSYEGVTAYHLSSSGEPIKRYSAEMLMRLVRDRGLDIR